MADPSTGQTLTVSPLESRQSPGSIGVASKSSAPSTVSMRWLSPAMRVESKSTSVATHQELSVGQMRLGDCDTNQSWDGNGPGPSWLPTVRRRGGNPVRGGVAVCPSSPPRGKLAVPRRPVALSPRLGGRPWTRRRGSTPSPPTGRRSSPRLDRCAPRVCGTTLPGTATPALPPEARRRPTAYLRTPNSQCRPRPPDC